VLELLSTEAEVVHCFAQREVLDGFPALADVVACRVAPDELMLVALRGSVKETASTYVESADPGGLVAEQSDGWAIWTLTGQGAAEAFARLSAIRPPTERPGFSQGEIGGVPARAIVLDDRIHVLVASSLGHHICERVVAVCENVQVRV
jgi:hypothetical protein